MKNYYFLFSLLLFFTSFEVKATEVIIMVYPGRILLGVDSRISYTEKTGKRMAFSGTKIFETNNTVFAFTGYAGSYGNYAPGSTNFNTQLYIKSILERRDRSILQNLKDLQVGLAKELTREFEIMQKVNPKKYLMEKGKGNFLTLAVLGNNVTGPFFCAFVASFIHKSNKIEVEDYVYQNSIEIVYFGASLDVERYHRSHPSLLKEEPISLMDKLMTIAVKEKPLEIGKPISIVEVTSKGINWIRKNRYPKLF